MISQWHICQCFCMLSLKENVKVQKVSSWEDGKTAHKGRRHNVREQLESLKIYLIKGQWYTECGVSNRGQNIYI